MNLFILIACLALLQAKRLGWALFLAGSYTLAVFVLTLPGVSS